MRPMGVTREAGGVSFHHSPPGPAACPLYYRLCGRCGQTRRYHGHPGRAVSVRLPASRLALADLAGHVAMDKTGGIVVSWPGNRPVQDQEVTIPVIIDCDPGTDDAVALLLALASPELAVLAVTVVGGNVGLRQTLPNA